MNVYVISEPPYRSTVWYSQTMNAINQKAAALRYDIKNVNNTDINFGLQKPLVIVVGTSNRWVGETLSELSKKNIHSIVVSCQPDSYFKNTSYILIDHTQAMNDCIELLHSNNRSNIALYGINSDSHADRIKIRCFTEYGMPESSIYSFEHSLADCYDKFHSDMKKYNAIICANDIAAVILINRLLKEGCRIPEDYSIISFGNSLVGKLFTVPLTTITLNHEELGIQSVLLYSYLIKNDSNIAITVKIPCDLTVGSSTVLLQHNKCQKKIIYTNSKFYSDTEVSEVMRVENTLQKCDNIDLIIIHEIIKKTPYTNIAYSAFISENAVKYRIKRLLKLSGLINKNEFCNLFSKYIKSLYM